MVSAMTKEGCESRIRVGAHLRIKKTCSAVPPDEEIYHYNALLSSSYSADDLFLLSPGPGAASVNKEKQRRIKKGCFDSVFITPKYTSFLLLGGDRSVAGRNTR